MGMCCGGQQYKSESGRQGKVPLSPCKISNFYYTEKERKDEKHAKRVVVYARR